MCATEVEERQTDRGSMHGDAAGEAANGNGHIVKPATDTLDYRIVVLENGLHCCIVHDADTDIAAAAMDVRAF